ncbi:hypothetical protein ACFPRL_02355 [Pseudoclavibacter helvolus]
MVSSSASLSAPRSTWTSRRPRTIALLRGGVNETSVCARFSNASRRTSRLASSPCRRTAFLKSQ